MVHTRTVVRGRPSFVRGYRFWARETPIFVIDARRKQFNTTREYKQLPTTTRTIRSSGTRRVSVVGATCLFDERADGTVASTSTRNVRNVYN